jgi:DNA polymerase-3 subunit beta
MKIRKEQLLLPLQKVVAVIERKQTMPILANVLVNVYRDSIVLTGTDLEIQLIANIECENDEILAFTVNARKLLDIVKLLPSDSVITIKSEDEKIKIQSGKSRFTLQTISAEAYPAFDSGEFPISFSIESQALKQVLDKTSCCMANQDVRFYLNGILVQSNGSVIKFVSSDGHRLAMCDITFPVDEFKIIIPRKAVLELSKILTGHIDIELSQNAMRFTIGDTVFYTKLIDAKYPDFSKVLNQKFNDVQVDRLQLKDTLQRVSVLANEKYKGVIISINNHVINISSHNPEHEEAEEEISCDFSGSTEIGFNVIYMIDALNHLGSQNIALEIADNASCCLISENNYSYIIMSMKL